MLSPKPGVLVKIGNKLDAALERVIPGIGVIAATGALWAGMGCYSAATIVHICG